MTQASPAGGADRSALMQLQETTGAYLATPSPDTRSAAAEAVISDQLASAEERLDIYAMAYRLRLFEVFGGDFEAVHTLIGDDAFGLLCRDYLAAHPPSHYSIRWAGQHFPAFVAAREPERSLVTEMAAFEWALGLALDVVDSAPLSVEALQTLAPRSGPSWPWQRIRPSSASRFTSIRRPSGRPSTTMSRHAHRSSPTRPRPGSSGVSPPLARPRCTIAPSSRWKTWLSALSSRPVPRA